MEILLLILILRALKQHQKIEQENIMISSLILPEDLLMEHSLIKAEGYDDASSQKKVVGGTVVAIRDLPEGLSEILLFANAITEIEVLILDMVLVVEPPQEYNIRLTVNVSLLEAALGCQR